MTRTIQWALSRNLTGQRVASDYVEVDDAATDAEIEQAVTDHVHGNIALMWRDVTNEEGAAE